MKEIAAEIARLSDQSLESVPRKHHIAMKLKGETGAYSNAVIVSDSDYVKFFIRSKDLQKKAEEKQFTLKAVDSIGTRAGFGFRFSGLRLNQIQANEEFFKTIIHGSINEAKRPNVRGSKG
ncbi:MAG TPA: hypothetical protein VK716_06790 [Terracidiphilus sp.]|jgi:hypothetical protein|nr:hypothetical protein [Terracidiphilus sp.]